MEWSEYCDLDTNMLRHPKNYANLAVSSTNPKRKLMKFITKLVAPILLFGATLLSCEPQPAFAQAQQSVVTKVTGVTSGNVVTVTWSCKSLIGGQTATASNVFTSDNEATLAFPLTAPTINGNTVTNTGTTCKVNVGTSISSSLVELDYAGITHVGVNGVDSVSYKYGDGFAPVFFSTTVNVRVKVPSFNVKFGSGVSNVGYRVECFNSGVTIGSVADRGPRTIDFRDLPLFNASSVCNLKVESNPNGLFVPGLLSGFTNGVSLDLYVVPVVSTTTTSTSVPVVVPVASAPIVVVQTVPTVPVATTVVPSVQALPAVPVDATPHFAG
jgi:hypothetical protein